MFGRDVDITEVRGISVVAAALTGPLLYGTARRAAGGGRTGRLAGASAALLWVSMPFVSRYAQEARPYAVAALLVTASTYLLLRASTGAARSPRAARGWWLAYALSLPAIVATNTVALLVVLGHAGWVLTGPARHRRPGVLAAAAGGLLCLPLLWAQSTQQAQVAFLLPPEPAELLEHATFALGSPAGAVVAGVAAVVAVAVARARRLVLLGVLWGVVPVPLLWAVSQVRPFWTTRYLVFVAPGTCLLLAAVATVAVPVAWRGRRRLAHLPVVAAGLLVALMAGTGLPMQFVFRSPVIGHGENMRATAAYVAREKQPGDAVLFLPDGDYRYRVINQLYPAAFAGVRDVALARSAAESATLVGIERSPDDLTAAMAGVRRVWVIGGPGPVVTASAGDKRKAELLADGYRLVSAHDERAFSVRLYVALPPG
nr:glycosyltransferase family 39 protein [Kineococcus siccus]